MSNYDVRMTMLLDLEKRVTKLEQKQKEIDDKELEWALSQLRYIEKTADESKAFAIIEKALGKKKTKLRAKTVRRC